MSFEFRKLEKGEQSKPQIKLDAYRQQVKEINSVLKQGRLEHSDLSSVHSVLEQESELPVSIHLVLEQESKRINEMIQGAFTSLESHGLMTCFVKEKLYGLNWEEKQEWIETQNQLKMAKDHVEMWDKLEEWIGQGADRSKIQDEELKNWIRQQKEMPWMQKDQDGHIVPDELRFIIRGEVRDASVNASNALSAMTKLFQGEVAAFLKRFNDVYNDIDDYKDKLCSRGFDPKALDNCSLQLKGFRDMIKEDCFPFRNECELKNVVLYDIGDKRQSKMKKTIL